MREVAIVLAVFLAGCSCGFALNPALDISQYAHSAWTVRNGFSIGNIFGIAQTPDGYLWLGGEFGLFRFDGVRAVPWQPPAGQELPEKFAFQLVGARDGTLWIGTFSGLASWDGLKLTHHPEFAGRFVQSLFQDREGTVWAATRGGVGSYTRLCAMGRGSSQCFGDDGTLGKTIRAISEDRSGVLWIAADSGLWQWKPGPPRRETAEPRDISGLAETEDGRILASTLGGRLMQLTGRFHAQPAPYPLQPPIGSTRTLTGRELKANCLLRDRNGGLWIGTMDQGLVHVYNGRTDVFRKSDGLSGDIVFRLFEDREGNIWVSTAGGLDRFREFPVVTFSSKQGLASDAVLSVLSDSDGSVWIGTRQGLTRWRNGKPTTFQKANGLPGDAVESLFQDSRGRLWVYAAAELAYFNGNRFITLHSAVPGEEAHSITGDRQGNLWLAGNEGLDRVREGRVVEKLPWPALGQSERAKVIVADRGGVWISFWGRRAVSYFKDGWIRASYKAADGLGKGRIADLRVDGDGALWVATEEGGLSRIKDGHIATLTTTDGLPCDTIHCSIEDNDRSLWLYTACGLVRIARSELNAWLADPRHRVGTTLLDAADGARLRALSPSSFSPVAARSSDGNLWFVTGDSVQVVDPRHLPYNDLPPPVHIEQVTADGKPYQTKQGMRLPAKVRDLSIDYTALSLVAPEKVHFKYKLEGQDQDWKEVINDRQAQYTNLSPRDYRFRVVASNDSGVWNETGDSLEFSIAPAYYQTSWFRTLCVAVTLALLRAAYQLRKRQLHREFHQGERLRRLEADLRHLNRVSMMGELTASVVHEVNQPISGVLNNGGACLRWLAGEVPNVEEARETARRIVRDAKRAGEIITRIRALASKKADTQKEELDLNATIQEVLSLVAEEAKRKSIIIRTEFADDLSPVSGDRVQLQQVALNLVMNAIEAMSSVGDRARELVVTTRNMDGDQVLVTVEDSGPGIDPQVIGKIFDSFYTTKPSGMGMGLSISRSILEAHGGRLWAEAKDGPGAVFHFTVPKHQEEGSIGAGAGA